MLVAIAKFRATEITAIVFKVPVSVVCDDRLAGDRF
jgi:hypothetical protein